MDFSKDSKERKFLMTERTLREYIKNSYVSGFDAAMDILSSMKEVDNTGNQFAQALVDRIWDNAKRDDHVERSSGNGKEDDSN